MNIEFRAESQTFHLYSRGMSYVFCVLATGQLAHLYWGSRVRQANLRHLLHTTPRAFSAVPDAAYPDISLDTTAQECPTYGTSDMRLPICHVEGADGSTALNLQYESHRIFAGKPSLAGLPATYVEVDEEATSVEIDLIDRPTGLQVTLLYTVYHDRDVLARSVRYANTGGAPVTLRQALSASVDFPHANFDSIQLSGAWARERHVVRRRLTAGSQSVESRRGASSHQQNPFFALVSPQATQTTGEAYGFNLVYSGNFLASAEVDQFATTRLSMGINPFDFGWQLAPKETFQAPEVVMVYSNVGIGAMSRTFHDLYRTRLARGRHRGTERPVLINNWEATYFNFNEDAILDLASVAAPLGIELFVLDDGWFGQRNDDTTSLGDWVVAKDKLPGGLGHLADEINRMGMKFGLWFEPEMVSKDSDLYRAHPDWCLHVTDRSRSESRNQLVLDLSREDVCDWMIDTVSSVLYSANIEYVKWDMNRHMTEIGSAVLAPAQQRETAHRYMLGLYRVLEALTAKFPNVLFESCSGGGGRFDPGMLYYMPQTWTSDNTDAMARLAIQYGTQMAYPSVSMASHVSIVPNHQVHRVTPLRTRGHVAMGGNLGYELDLRSVTETERHDIAAQIAIYKEIRSCVQFGDYFALTEGTEDNLCAWMHVSKDKQSAVVTAVQVLALANHPWIRLKLQGLDSEATYEVTQEDGTTSRHGGDELMAAGWPLTYLHGDFESCILKLQAIP